MILSLSINIANFHITSLIKYHHPCQHNVALRNKISRDGEIIDFFDFLSIRLALSIIDKKLHLSIKNRFCPELKKANKIWTFCMKFNSGQL